MMLTETGGNLYYNNCTVWFSVCGTSAKHDTQATTVRHHKSIKPQKYNKTYKTLTEPVIYFKHHLELKSKITAFKIHTCSRPWLEVASSHRPNWTTCRQSRQH